MKSQKTTRCNFTKDTYASQWLQTTQISWWSLFLFLLKKVQKGHQAWHEAKAKYFPMQNAGNKEINMLFGEALFLQSSTLQRIYTMPSFSL